MKKAIFSLFVLLTPIFGFAQTVSINDARQKALSFINRNASLAKGKTLTTSDVTLAYQQSCNDETYYYIFNRSNDSGYVIVGGDENAKEILGFSDTGSFDYASAPPDLKWWLSQYESQIKLAIADSKNVSNSKSAGLSSGTLTSTSRTSISPLMSTKWGQDTPYNLAITGGKNDVLAGCVATAGSQVMKKWAYPTKGNDYAFPEETVGTYTAVATNTGITYEWDKMKDSYTSLEDDYTDANAKAVADLVYRLGRACNMQYSTEGSGSTSDALGLALIKYFNYDKAMTLETRDRYTDSEWDSLVYIELSAGRPVIYCGASTKEGGHCFVCDGYDNSANTFHINWGWRGYNDTYFTLTGTKALLPYTFTDDEGYGFTNSQEILCGVQPEAGGVLKHIVYYSSPSLSATTGDRGSYIQISCDADNLTFSDEISVPLGVILTNTQTGEQIFAASTDSHNIKEGIGKYYNIDLYFTVPSTVDLGASYTVSLAYKDENNTWQKAQTALSTTDPVLTINNPTNSLYLVSAPDYGDNGEYVTKEDFKVTLHVKNQSTKDITTNLSFYIYPSAGGTSVGYVGLNSKTFKAGAVTDITINASDIKYNNMSAGNKYTIQLMDIANSYDIAEAFLYKFSVCEKISIETKISSAKWATICLPFSAAIPTDIKAYSIMSTNGSELVMQEVTNGKFAMNTPYLIYGTAGTYTFTGPDTPRDIFTSGMLTGITKESTESSPVKAPANSYVLAMVDNILGFYKTPEELACRQYSAYLKLAGNAIAMPYFTFDSAYTTGIESVNTIIQNDNKAFNILGQQVKRNVKGLVIINGKKYYNK